MDKSLLKWLREFDGGRFIAAEFLLVVGAVSLFVKVQSDSWWHLAAGRGMARTGHVMLTEQFSHTAFGAPWANYEWLTQWLFFRLYSAGGMPLLTATCALSLLGACLFAWTLMRGAATDRVLIFALAFPSITGGWAVRPQAFTLFLLCLTVYLVVRERFWPLVFLFLLWANLHGAVALGLIVLAGDFVVAAATRRDLKRRLFVGSLCFGATFLTPLGAGYWPEILRSLQRSRVNQIQEWMPPTLGANYVFFWLIAAAFIWLVVTRWKRLGTHEDRVLCVVAVLLLPLALRSMRNIGPFALVAAPAIARLIWLRTPANRVPRIQPHLAAPLVRASLVGVSAVAVVLLLFHRWTMNPPPAEWTPVSAEAAAAIRRCPEPLYNHYNDGGYLIWFTPEQKVFLDSRQDPYPAELLRAQLEAERSGDYRALLDRYSVRCAVLNPNSQALSALKRSGWREDYRDSRWVVVRLPEPGPRR